MRLQRMKNLQRPRKKNNVKRESKDSRFSYILLHFWRKYDKIKHTYEIYEIKGGTSDRE